MPVGEAEDSHIILTKGRYMGAWQGYSLYTGIHTMRVAGGDNDFAARWDGIVDDNQWHHVVFVYNGGHGDLYLDGIDMGNPVWSTGNADDGSFPSTEQIFRIGNGHWNNYFKGQMSDVMIFNRALGSDEVGILYNYY